MKLGRIMLYDRFHAESDSLCSGAFSHRSHSEAAKLTLNEEASIGFVIRIIPDGALG